MMKLPVVALALVVCMFGFVPQSAAVYAAAVTAGVSSANVVHGPAIVAASDREARQFLHDHSHGLLPLNVTDQYLMPGKVTLVASAGQSFGDSYVNVPVSINLDGKLARTVLVGYRIVRYVTRTVAVHDLTAGQVLQATDLVTRRVLDDGSGAIDAGNLAGRILTVSIPAGQTPLAWQTITQEIVHSGQPVTLIIRDGNVALSDDVVARTSGGMGDQVTIYDEHADHTMSAIVTAPGQVEVNLPEVGD